MRRGCLGCSFPILIGIIAVFLGLFIIGFLAGPIGKSLVPGINLPDWLSVPQPHPSLPAEEVFTLFGFPITNSILGSWLAIVVLIVLSLVITRRAKIIPSRLQAGMEAVLGWLLNFCQEVAGPENGRRFFPLVATIFLFVITNAWLNLLPGFGSIMITNPEGHVVPLFRGASTDINLPLALALISFIIVGYYGIKMAGGIGYLGQFINVRRLFASFSQIFRGRVKAGMGMLFFGVIDIVVGLLELLSQFIRILSFTFRLFGNMTAGEILILMIMFLVPWVAAIPFYGLELLVGFIQALIFGGLTLVFLTVAVTPHAHEEKH